MGGQKKNGIGRGDGAKLRPFLLFRIKNNGFYETKSRKEEWLLIAIIGSVIGMVIFGWGIVIAIVGILIALAFLRRRS